MMREGRNLLFFVLLNGAACVVVFNDALIGRSLLAPLDIAPTMFSNYRFAAPGAGDRPVNHYPYDQLTYDLPLQHTVFQAYSRWEIPWWDPFTYGGRPFLADPPLNGTDPVRVFLYHLLPFELAYNWTSVLHFFLNGLGMFVLLRRFGFANWICCSVGLTFEFASFNAFALPHPWLPGSYLYYPFLWALWDAEFAERSRWRVPLAGLLVAGIFYAGNLQSHAYLPIFCLVLLLGYGGFSFAKWRQVLPIVSVSACLGGLLASPMLLSEIELFLLSPRPIGSAFPILGYLGGLASLSAIFPWMLGTFRTLDAGKLFGESGLGFHLFIGCSGFILAILGAMAPRGDRSAEARRRSSLFLLIAYFLIVSTPLRIILYSRTAGLAVMGLIVLAALGLESLRASPVLPRKVGWVLIWSACLVALCANLVGLVIYPAFEPKIHAFVLSYAKAHPHFEAAIALREFQVQNLPNEVTFKNPEVWLRWLGWLALAALFFASSHRRQFWLPAIATLNLIPLLLFCHRFIPHQPVGLWQRLLAGGPLQHQAAALLRDTHERMAEPVVRETDRLFPAELSHLYGIRTLHGYVSLQPKSLLELSSDEQRNYQSQMADLFFEGVEPGSATGVWRTNSATGLVRFQWSGTSPRPFEVVEDGLNTVRLRFAPGAAGELVWTDTQFPGWHATMNAKQAILTPIPPCFSKIAVPPDGGELVLNYRPRFLTLGLALAGLGLAAGLTPFCFPLVNRSAAAPRAL